MSSFLNETYFPIISVCRCSSSVACEGYQFWHSNKTCSTLSNYDCSDRVTLIANPDNPIYTKPGRFKCHGLVPNLESIQTVVLKKDSCFRQQQLECKKPKVLSQLRIFEWIGTWLFGDTACHCTGKVRLEYEEN